MKVPTVIPSGPSGRLALDIETISPGFSPDDDVDFENPEHFEVTVIGLCYEGPDAGGRLPRQKILFRESPDKEAELDLLREFNSALWAYSPKKLVTYAGDFFDIPVLKARPELIAPNPGNGLTGDLDAAFGNTTSVDLGDYAAETYGYGTRLDGLLDQEDGVEVRHTMFSDFDHGLSLEEVRPSDASTDYVDSSDLPGILDTWLHAKSESHDPIGPCNIDETKRMITDYVTGDIEHLLTIEETL